MKQYDVIVLGSGPGGYVAAIKAGQNNLKVALIEKEAIGGVCLNWGCIPTKALLKSAKVYQQFLHAKDYGLVVDKANIGFDWKAITTRKNTIVKRLTGGVGMLLKKNNVDVYEGYGEVLSPTKVKVNEETLETKHLILSTGASPIVPPIPGLEDGYRNNFVLTSKEMLDIESVPEKLVIIGGGVIGIEFATIFNSFGSEVTIIEREKQVLLGVDDDARDLMMKTLKKNKVNVLTGATVTEIKKDGVVYTTNDGSKTVPASKVLLSVGMKANSKSFEKLNLQAKRGFVQVDDQMKTSQSNVYAIGDVNGKMLLAHVASHQGIVAVEDILGKQESINYEQIPSAIFSFPEIAQIGLTEAVAKERGLDINVSKFPLQANGKSLSAGDREGFIKMITTKPYNEIIGVHIVSENASDLISEALMTMKLEGTADEIAHAVHPHPTVSEIFHEAALGIIDKPIHI
ncbi:MAG: dihydrolipoyl dehydrogenase [Bacilli bacterium]|nr:dihydrolipoyl dehydrogenase [Bacilli bacterium]MBN2877691.1 dihydrolipoyl dehydrogenase [Bacilli bacterium]